MKENIIEKYKKVSSPQELLKFMNKYIEYGFLSCDNKIYQHNDSNFNKNWYSKAILQSEEDILKSLSGTCWDQVELERSWFYNYGYEYMTIYIMVKLNYDNSYPTHTYLIYKDKDNTWNLFENADFNNRGIYKFNNYMEAIEYQYNNYLDYLRKLNIKEEELKNICIYKFEKPLKNISPKEYIKFVTNSEIINLNSK